MKVLEESILEKPKSTEDAKIMLKRCEVAECVLKICSVKFIARFRLSGQMHTVVSGVALITSTDGVSSTLSFNSVVSDYLNFSVALTVFDEATNVTFASLSDSFVNYYVDTGEPM